MKLNRKYLIVLLPLGLASCASTSGGGNFLNEDLSAFASDLHSVSSALLDNIEPVNINFSGGSSNKDDSDISRGLFFAKNKSKKEVILQFRNPPEGFVYAGKSSQTPVSVSFSGSAANKCNMRVFDDSSWITANQPINSTITYLKSGDVGSRLLEVSCTGGGSYDLGVNVSFTADGKQYTGYKSINF
ncbi:hypothetical protein QIW57_02025 [Francisellaceae bacterium CB52]|jgi:hypothetical protein